MFFFSQNNGPEKSSEINLNENVLIKNDLKMVKMKDGCSFQ